MTVKEHENLQDITIKETNEIKDLFVSAFDRFKNVKSEDELQSICNHVSGYDLITDSYNDDVYTISIGTDNTEPNTLQGIRLYIDKETMIINRFIDVYFNDEEYPFEDYEVMSEV